MATKAEILDAISSMTVLELSELLLLLQLLLQPLAVLLLLLKSRQSSLFI